MNVLMITPRIDKSHDILGFIPPWIRKLAERVDKLYVITQHYNRKTPLPENVIVYGVSRLGEKWDRANKLVRLMRLLGRKIYFHSTMLRVVPKVDVIFCHMYPNFTVIAAPYAKLFRKPIVTWFTHGHVSRRLRIAHFLASKMVTASKESFRIRSNKIIITGHGIDTDRFKPVASKKKEVDKNIILSVSRISPRKDLETLIKAADILVNEKRMNDLEFVIVGGVPMASQEEYYEKLKMRVKELELEDYVKFVGSVPYSGVVSYYQKCNIFVSPSQTGSIDKNVLEAMACEKPAIVCNEAFENVFGDYSEELMFKKEDPYDLVQKITFVLGMNKDQYTKLCFSMRQIVEKEHNVKGLMDKLINVFEDSRTI